MRARPPSALAFAVTMLVAGAVLSFVARQRGLAHAYAPAAVGGVLVVAAVVAPKAVAPLARAWAAFGRLVGRVMTPVWLTAFYVLVLTPTALVLRVFGRDPLHRRRDPAATSYWNERSGRVDLDRLG